VQPDLIILRDLEIKSRIGCCEEEQLQEQNLLVDCEIAIDAKLAASSLELTDTVCYQTLRSLVLELASSKPWTLVEEFGETICQNIFSNFSNANTVKLEIKKLVFEDTAWVGVQLNRTREN